MSFRSMEVQDCSGVGHKNGGASETVMGKERERMKGGEGSGAIYLVNYGSPTREWGDIL